MNSSILEQRLTAQADIPSEAREFAAAAATRFNEVPAPFPVTTEGDNQTAQADGGDDDDDDDGTGRRRRKARVAKAKAEPTAEQRALADRKRTLQAQHRKLEKQCINIRACKAKFASLGDSASADSGDRAQALSPLDAAIAQNLTTILDELTVLDEATQIAVVSRAEAPNTDAVLSALRRATADVKSADDRLKALGVGQ
jgi:hypothetical protein